MKQYTVEQFPDINRYKQKLEVLSLLKRQLEKDFDLSEPLELTDTPELAYQHLFAQLLPLVKDVDRSSPAALAQLLYRIDVRESKVTAPINSDSHQDYHEQVTHLVLERELLKVLTRLYFSQQLKS